MYASHLFPQLVQQAHELIREAEALQREQVSDKLILVGERIRESLLRAEEFTAAACGHLDAAKRVCEEIAELRERIQAVLDDAKGRLAPDQVDADDAHRRHA